MITKHRILPCSNSFSFSPNTCSTPNFNHAALCCIHAELAQRNPSELTVQTNEMSEDLELQSKIAQLAGRINRHKTVQSPAPSSVLNNTQKSIGRIFLSPSDKWNMKLGSSAQEYGRGAHQWTTQRGTPYGNPRGRGWTSRAAPHRNRSLVVNPTAQDETQVPQMNTTFAHGVGENNPYSAGWVSKRDRHMQLINRAVYEQKTQERAQAMESTRKQKEQQREERETIKLRNYIQALNTASYPRSSTPPIPPIPQLFINNIRFLVADRGSKLIKARGMFLCLLMPQRWY